VRLAVAYGQAHPSFILIEQDQVGAEGLRGYRSAEEISMGRLLSRLIRSESGATAVEYGLICALIALAIVGALTGLTGKLTATFNNLSAKL
jgi:pilus assembly protein Flp/PilA